MSSVRDIVVERAQGYCELCGAYAGSSLHWHHIFFRRKNMEMPETTCMLCPDCHQGTEGVHGKNGHYKDVVLKIRAQDVLLQKGWTKDKITEKTGRWYIEEDYFV